MSTPRPPRESATVILARDGVRELEVFMVRRHLASDFIGGAFVFPGGSLDEDDCAPELLAHFAGPAPEAAAAAMGLAPERALGHWGAAIRETFEEAGVLLAYRAGAPVSYEDEASRAYWAERRRRLLDKEIAWGAFVSEEQLQLAGDRVAYFAHWITPEGVPKRFTTRFFVAEAPAHQHPLPDEREVDQGVWVSPQAALDAYARGEMTMIFPTLRTLEELAGFAAAADLMAACEGREVVTRLPRVVQRENEVVILLPGDAGYHEAAGQPTPPFDPSKR